MYRDQNCKKDTVKILVRKSNEFQQKCYVKKVRSSPRLAPLEVHSRNKDCNLLNHRIHKIPQVHGNAKDKQKRLTQDWKYFVWIKTPTMQPWLVWNLPCGTDEQVCTEWPSCHYLPGLHNYRNGSLSPEQNKASAQLNTSQNQFFFP